MNPNEDHPTPQNDPPLSEKEYEVERENPAHATARCREKHHLRHVPQLEDRVIPLYRIPACYCALVLAFFGGVAAGWVTARHYH